MKLRIDDWIVILFLILIWLTKLADFKSVLAMLIWYWIGRIHEAIRKKSK